MTVLVTACGSSEKAEVVEQIVVREPGEAVEAAGEPSSDTAAVGAAQLVALGEDAFVRCSVCHVNEAGAPSSAGPNLHGVIGRTAGSLDDFPYTDALAASDVTWDEATLDQYLADPAGYIPGSEMLPGTVADADERAAIIAYLSSTSE
jgi:cytochrome c